MCFAPHIESLIMPVKVIGLSPAKDRRVTNSASEKQHATITTIRAFRVICTFPPFPRTNNRVEQSRVVRITFSGYLKACQNSTNLMANHSAKKTAMITSQTMQMRIILLAAPAIAAAATLPAARRSYIPRNERYRGHG